MKQRIGRPSQTETSVPGIVVRTTRRGFHRLHWFHIHIPRPSKRVLVIAIGVVVLAAAGYLAWNTYSNYKTTAARVAFTVDGKTYSKQDIKTLTNYPVSRGATAAVTAKQAFEYYKRQAAAQQVGITLSAAEIAQAKATVFPNVTSSDPWVTLASEDAALTARLTQATTSTTAAGYYFNFPFSDHIVAADTAADVPVTAGMGDATVIAKDRAYAKSQADSYHDQLVQKKITPEQVLTAIKANAKLGYSGLAGSNPSFQFTGLGQVPPNSHEIYLSEADKKVIFTQVGKVGVGDVTVGQTMTSATSATTATYADSYYYFTVITKAGSVQSSAEFQATLNKLAATYKGVN